jgi:hypothetical protein
MMPLILLGLIKFRNVQLKQTGLIKVLAVLYGRRITRWGRITRDKCSYFHIVSAVCECLAGKFVSYN